MNIEKLDIFNKKILKEYDTSRFQNSVDCIMPGYFAGNDILFIAQNPGMLKQDVEGDVLYLQSYQKKEYDKLNEYYIKALKSSRGTYGIFINDVYGEDWSRISFTNVYKCPFVDNIIPESIPDIEKKILLKQIEFLNPKLIVAVGSVAKHFMWYDNQKKSIKTLYMQHPAYLKRTGRYARDIEKYKNELHFLLQQK